MTCCIAGGGPAGMMLGYLLARRGHKVTVLEKHKDFFRDFRGDTVHPSTLEVFNDLGLLDSFLKLPHQKLTKLGGRIGDFSFILADLSRVPTRCKFIALMPQWDFLNFLAEEAKKFPSFELRMGEAVTDLLRDGDKVVGVKTTLGEVRADLTVGCDGRHSTVRKAAGFEVIEFGVPIDVLWFHLPRLATDREELLGTVNSGKALILINRGDYFQAGFLIRKGSFAAMQQQGLEAFQNSILEVTPYLGDRVRVLDDWDKIKLLTVQINRLKKWDAPGVLCIGDAAHAMSPAGGVGINLAIQDAVATANVLTSSKPDPARVQKRREFPTRVTQFVQANLAHRALARVFRSSGPMTAPLALRTAVGIPALRYAVARVLAVGVRPEHPAN